MIVHPNLCELRWLLRRNTLRKSRSGLVLLGALSDLLAEHGQPGVEVLARPHRDGLEGVEALWREIRRNRARVHTPTNLWREQGSCSKRDMIS